MSGAQPCNCRKSYCSSRGLQLKFDLAYARKVIEAEAEAIASVGRIVDESFAKAVEMIALAQQQGLPVTADVSAHQLYLTDIDINEFNTNCHVLPPLRSQRDRDALRQGVKDGVISAICSDHTPHEEDAKQAPFPSTEPGMSTLETLMPLTLRLASEGVVDIMGAVRCMTQGPASILGIGTGTLQPGAIADICIIDADMSWMVSPDVLLSQGHNSAFIGWEMFGRATHTFMKGHLIYSLEQ